MIDTPQEEMTVDSYWKNLAIIYEAERNLNIANKASADALVFYEAVKQTNNYLAIEYANSVLQDAIINANQALETFRSLINDIEVFSCVNEHEATRMLDLLSSFENVSTCVP